MLNEHRACCDCDYALPEAEFNNHQAVYKFARHVADKHKRNSVYYLNALVGGNPTITLRVGVARNNAKALSKRNNVVIDEREFHVHQNQELQCLECEKFLSESYYDEHIMRVHKVCPWCKNQVKHATIKTLVEHVQQEHPEKSIFSCEHCQEFVSLDEDLASAHTQEACYKETNNHKFQCAVPGCNRSFSKTDSAGHHAVHAHHLCSVCDNFQINSTNPLDEEVERLALHLHEQHGRTVYLCREANRDGSKCVFIGTNKKIAQEHAKTHGSRKTIEKDDSTVIPFFEDQYNAPQSPIRGDDNKFTCNKEECNKAFSKKDTCLHHIITGHQGCPSCNFTLSDSEDLETLASHLATAHPPKYSTVYFCPDQACNFLALDKGRAERHRKSNHPQKPPIEKYNTQAQSTAIVDLRIARASGDVPFNIPVWCWFKKWSADKNDQNIITLKNKRCNEELLTKNDVIEHFRCVHNICFECIEKKALFKNTQSLLKHVQKYHADEPKSRSKCNVYDDKKVCTHCCDQFHYESEEALMIHMHEKH